jgi:hypothetical protein
VISASRDVVTGERMDDEAIRRGRRQSDAQASILAAVSRTRRQNLAAANFTAEGVGDGGKVGPSSHGASDSDAGSGAAAGVCALYRWAPSKRRDLDIWRPRREAAVAYGCVKC